MPTLASGAVTAVGYRAGRRIAVVPNKAGVSMVEADPSAELAKLFDGLRRRSGHSYASLARVCDGVSASTLHRYCQGASVPMECSTVDRIARACTASRAEMADLRRLWVLASYHRRLPTPTPPADARGGSPSQRPTGGGTGTVGTDPVGPRPRQLPAAVPHFAGRSAELAALTALADRPTTGTVVISAIGGTAGIGKTALAVHWAHRVTEQFEDGQLYVDLRGFDPTGSITTPGEAVRGFLDALGVPPELVPSGLDAQVGLYRSVLAGRRVLVVLDNARDSAQVRPLLPGTPGCLVLVTSRNQLSSLVAGEGARPLTLDLLSTDEARQVLIGRLGWERVAAEPEAVDEIIRRCARLPLALSVVAARAAAHQGFRLVALLDELPPAGTDLDAFAGEDPTSDLRAVLSWSYRLLSPAAADLFRLLGLHPGPDIAGPAAASLAGVPVRQVRPLLAELTRAHLLTEHVPGRYTFHDLLRAYAAEQATALDPDDVRHTAMHRMLDHYLHTSHAALACLHPSSQPISIDPPHADVTVVELPDEAIAFGWLTGEHQVLLMAVEHAAAVGFDRHSLHLAFTLATYLDRRGHWHDQVRTATGAVAAAQRLGDGPGLARAQRGLGFVHARLGRFAESRELLQRAVDLFGELDDPVGRGYSHLNLAFVHDRQGDPVGALRQAEAAYETFRTTDHRTGQAQSLNTVGWHHAQLGDFQRALEYCQLALALLEELEHRNGQADTLDSLGYAYLRLGRPDQAVTCYQQALDLYRSLGDRHKEAGTLECLGDTHQAAGVPELAATAWLQAIEIFESLGHTVTDDLRAKVEQRR